MPTPEKHALLPASSAARWLVCTAAPRFEEQFPENTSSYAEEGRLAHSFCELKVAKRFSPMGPRTFSSKLEKLKSDPKYDPEMEKTSDIYIKHLDELAQTYNSPPAVYAEVRVDLSDWVPEGFGTCDCIMIGEGKLCITDYKHGKGVPVSATGNPQMRLYALGALKRYTAIFGDTIKTVVMTIDQPRISEEVSRETITVEELRAWGEWVKPIARKAFDNQGEFVPGDHCRFCRGKAQCRARANENTALEDFAGAVDTLTDAEIGNLLERGKHLVDWYKDLEEYALKSCLDGKTIPGWKVVAGRSVRAFSDQDKALEAIIAAGWDESLVYDRKPKSLTELEKMMTKADFATVVGEYVVKPQGKPALVPESDKREPYSTAASDFGGVGNG